ncbi:hypothetical protein AB8Z38_22920 [Bradyrhizobium sp. LLZ17]|uniref:Uncharacterized protein n=1 Tax=Bradyrhizobium sp. LLZ17 TaxID=3239388 RepID=A0AB39XCV0_9BRAD
MSLADCRAVFAHQPAHQIASQLQDATTDLCGCELFPMADTSPGPVADVEALHLIVSDPTDLDANGLLNPASLIRIDTSGLSVLRENAGDVEFDHTITELKARSAAANKPRSFLGVCIFSAQTVRHQNGERLVGVYDTALPMKPHHADLVGPCLQKIQGLSNSQHEKAKRKRIKEIISLVGRCFDPARSFRNGTFLKHS